MSTLTVRQLDEEDKRLLRVRAAANGRSMEAEARSIIRHAVRPSLNSGDVMNGDTWVQRLIELGRSVGGVDLDIPPRESARIPDLS